jgi:hypothetical protein
MLRSRPRPERFFPSTLYYKSPAWTLPQLGHGLASVRTHIRRRLTHPSDALVRGALVKILARGVVGHVLDAADAVGAGRLLALVEWGWALARVLASLGARVIYTVAATALTVGAAECCQSSTAWGETSGSVTTAMINYAHPTRLAITAGGVLRKCPTIAGAGASAEDK